MVRGAAADQFRAVAGALAAGVTYFDTAPSYGDGRSEENLGRALASSAAGDEAVVGTKVRLSRTQLADPYRAIRQSLEASLRRLGRDRVDLFQLHNPVRESASPGEDGSVERSLARGEVADAMVRCVQDGLARHIGFTGLGDTESVHGLVEGGPFEAVQAYFNAIDPSGVWPGASGGEQDFRSLIPRAADNGLGVLGIRVFAAGALAGDVDRHSTAGQVAGRPLVPGAEYAEDVGRSRKLSRLAAELGLESSLELGLRFALGAPGIASVLVGFSDTDQLEAALRWQGRGPLAAPEVDRVVGIAREPGPGP